MKASLKIKNTATFVLSFAFILCSIFSSQAQKAILLENFNLIDGTGGELKTNKSLLIVSDTIHSILNSGDKIPVDEYEKIDLKGKYVLPGLFDSHTHLANDPSDRNTIDIVKNQLAFLTKHGITGVRDMAGDTRLLNYLSRQAMLDEIVSPDIYYSALIAGPRFFSRDRRVASSSKGYKIGEAPWMKSITSETDLVKAIAEAKGTGITGIKLYANLPPNLINNITKEAQSQGLLVWAHASIMPTLPSKLVESGVNALSHSAMLASEQLFNPPVSGQRPTFDTNLTENAPKLKGLIRKMVQQNVYLDPTVTVFRNRESHYKNSLLATQMAFEGGVKIIIGTDRGLDIKDPNSLPLIDEMAALHIEAKIPALEVIKAATKNSADFLRMGDTLGTIEAGKKATILIVNKNPLENMKNLLTVFKVFKNGKSISIN